MTKYTKIQLLKKIATMYYIEHLTQAEIGRSLNMSRSTVSRLLQEARDKGVVTITVDGENLEQSI